jgi:hypothetical protein
MLLCGFWRCSAIAGLALLTNGALAQSPREVTFPIDATIKLQIGETRIFQFGEAVTQISMPKENIVEIRPEPDQPDHSFSFKGIAMGGVDVTAQSEDGRTVRRMRLVVGGHLVKVHEWGEPDSISIICDEFSCGTGMSRSVLNYVRPTLPG